MSTIFPILFFVAVLAAGGAFAYAAYLAEVKRAEELDRVAQDLGFTFAPQGDVAFLRGLSGFHLFSQGHSAKLWNLLRGKTDDMDVAIFDYKYVTGHGKHRHTWNHTVICFQYRRPELPTFSLRPESVWHKIGTWFGYQDVDFETHPAFSRNYLLRGRDESAIRDLFTDDVLSFYEKNTGLGTEGSGNTLVYYRPAARVAPQAIRSFMEEGFKVLSLYQSRA